MYYTVLEDFYKYELTLDEIVVYSIIYGYSQCCNGVFFGTKKYIAALLCKTKRTADKVISSLLDKGLITCEEIDRNGHKYTAYAATGKIKASESSDPETANTPAHPKAKRNSAKIDELLLGKSPQFLDTWETLTRQPKWAKKTNDALLGNLRALAELNESEAIGCMNYSINGGYQGLFVERFSSTNPHRFKTKSQVEEHRIIEILNQNPFGHE